MIAGGIETFIMLIEYFELSEVSFSNESICLFTFGGFIAIYFKTTFCNNHCIFDLACIFLHIGTISCFKFRI